MNLHGFILKLNVRSSRATNIKIGGTNTPKITINIGRLGNMPLLHGFFQEMDIQPAIDNIIKPHGNWQILSVGGSWPFGMFTLFPGFLLFHLSECPVFANLFNTSGTG